MREHVCRTAQVRLFHLLRLRSVHRQLGRGVTIKLVVDYCNAVLAGLPAITLAPLQRVLHAAACLVNDPRLHDHVTPAHKPEHYAKNRTVVAISDTIVCSYTN